MHLWSFLVIACVFNKAKSADMALLEYCSNNFELQYCSISQSSDNVLWNLYVTLDNHFSVRAPRPCVNAGFSFRWVMKHFSSGETVKEFDKYIRRSVLFVEAKSLPPDKYILELTITYRKTTINISFRCFVRFVTEPPIAVMKGAQYKVVIRNTTLILDASPSISRSGNRLTYEWTCKGKHSPPDVNASVCHIHERYKKITKLTVLPTTSPEQVFWLTLMLTVYDGTRYSVAQTTLQYNNHPYPIGIDLIANCPDEGHYFALPNVLVKVEVQCFPGNHVCKHYRRIEWTPTNANIITKCPNNLCVSAKLVDAPRSDRAEIAVRGYPYSGVAVAVYYFNVFPGLVVDCVLDPKDIAPIFTLTTVSCAPIRVPAMSKLIDVIDGIFPLTLARNVVPQFQVHLSSSYPQYEVTNAALADLGSQTLKVSYSQTPYSKDKTIQDLATLIYTNRLECCSSPKNLGNEGRVWESVQIINSLMAKLLKEEEIDETLRYFNIDLSEKILSDMLTFPTDFVLDDLIFVLVRLMRPLGEPKCLKYAASLSQICRHLIAELKEVLHSKNAYFYERIVAKARKIFERSIVYLTSYNYFDYRSLNVSTKEQFHRTTANNTIEMTKILCLIRSLTWDFKKGPLRERGLFMQYSSENKLNRNIEIERHRIELPEYLGFIAEEPIMIIVNTFNQSLFYWDNSTITTDVVSLTMTNYLGTPKYTVDETANLFMTNSTISKYRVVNVSFPSIYSTYNDTSLPVFAIDMKKSTKLILTFRNVSEALKIILLRRRRPLMADFSKSLHIDKDTVIKLSKSTYDTWLHIGILPAIMARSSLILPLINEHETTETNDTNGYGPGFSIIVTQQQCLQWRSNLWDSSMCEVGDDTTADVIHCQCRLAEHVAASSISQLIKRRDLITLHFVVDYFPNLIAFGIIIPAIALYCLAMCLRLVRRTTKVHVYYLGDNLHTHNYAYLILVKTSDRLRSGTTANVVIKLYGHKTKSRPHVLNYPDPDQYLLQKGNEDYFVLTTRQHLGNILRIEMWSDCLQIQPTWRCDFVKICDLQTKKWYIFEVDNLFTPLKNGKHVVSVEGRELSENGRRKVTFKRIMSLFMWRTGAEHTWNIFSPKHDLRLGYAERLTILLCTITTTSAASLLICIYPQFINTDAIFNDNIMNSMSIYEYSFIISCITFLPSKVFVATFRNMTRKLGRKCIHRPKIVPENYKFICWFLLILIILISSVYVLFTSTGIDKRASFICLITTSVSLAINIFILENVYIGLCETIDLCWPSKVVYNYKAIIRESQYQKIDLKRTIPGEYSLRPYLTHLYKPMSRERYERKSREIDHWLKLSQTFRDFLAFCLYVLLLYVLVAINLDSHRIYMNKNIENMVHGKTYLGFKDVKTKDQYASLTFVNEIILYKLLCRLLQYLNDTFVNVVHGTTWYGDFNVSELELMGDAQTKILGTVRIKQKRVAAAACPARKLCSIIFNITKCAPPYEPYYQDAHGVPEKGLIWEFHDSLERSSLYGEFANYNGGGFLDYIGLNLEDTYRKIWEIVKENWLDMYTRAILVEFWAYNANNNLFSLVTILFELNPDGIIYKRSLKVNSITLLFVDFTREIASVVAFSIFFILNMYQLGNIISKMVAEKGSFWKKPSHWLDIVIWVTNVLVIGLTAYKQNLVENILDEVDRKQSSEFTPYVEIEFFHEVHTITIAILMCISLIGTWRFLRFGVLFRVLQHTMLKLRTPLLGAFVYSLIIYIQYAVIGYLLFGDHIRYFRNISSAITVVALLALDQYKGYDHNEMENTLPVYCRLFYMGYSASLLYLLKVYISIITNQYTSSRRYITSQKPLASIFTYFARESKYRLAYFKRRKKHLIGGDDYLNAEIKDESTVTKKFSDDKDNIGKEHVPCNKFECMSIMAIASMYNTTLRKNKKVLTEDDIELMKSIVWYNQHINEGETLTYYQLKLNENESHFVSKENLDEMATVVGRLFEPETKVKPSNPISTDKISYKRLTRIGKALHILKDILGNIGVTRNLRR